MAAKFNKISLFLLLSACSLAAFADSLVLQSSVTEVQPGCGLVLWPDNEAVDDDNATHNDVISLEYLYGLPCKVVTGKDTLTGQIQYDWTWLENCLNAVSARGHQLVLRWRYAYPGSKDVDGSTKGMTAVPAYIKALPGYTETYKKVSGDGPTYYPDWTNTELQWFTRQFFADFAAQYGADPRIAYLEVGFGHWAEYHIYGNKLNLGVNFPSKQYQHDFFLHLDSIMPIPWAISIDASDEDYTPFTASPDMMALPFGLFDDSFMHAEHEIGSGGEDNGYNERCWQAMDTTRWRRGVAGGEISYYEDSDQHNFLNPAGMYGHTWEEQAAKYHITFMIANDATEGSYGTVDRFRSAGLATGYRFCVLEASTSSSETLLRVTNTGVAPLYRDAFFAISGTRSPTSLRGLCPGDTLICAIPAPLTSPSDLHVASDYVLSSRSIGFEANCPITLLTGLKDGDGGVEVTKIIRDGRFYILRNKTIYDIYGRR